MLIDSISFCTYLSSSISVEFPVIGAHGSYDFFRDVTTFELRMFSPDSKFDECFKGFIVECEFVEKILVRRLISCAQTARKRR